MKIVLESTPKMVDVVVNSSRNVKFEARLWVGHTDRGIPIFALIPRIACERNIPIEAFEYDLEEPVSQHAANDFPLKLLL